MIKRNLGDVLSKVSKKYPVVTVTGPRQSGKTTLVRSVFPDKPYLSMEALDLRSYAEQDPRGLLAEYSGGAVLDEVQHVPALLSYLQVEVDERPEPGRFILTGSQHFGLSQQISQSLAGRTAVLVLPTLSLDEVRLIPCRVPPHRDAPHASPAQRLMMLRLAISGERALSIDERELRRDGPSYMIDTLQSLRAEFGNVRPLALLIGMDALQGLDRWHRWRELADLCHIVVATRPGWTPPQSGAVAALVQERRVEEVEELRVRPAGRLLFCPVTTLDISASRIRALLGAGKSPRYLLPGAVLDYIQTTNLYQNGK